MENKKVLSFTKRYGNTVYTVNAYCPEEGTHTFEDRLLHLIKLEMERSGQAVLKAEEPSDQ